MILLPGLNGRDITLPPSKPKHARANIARRKKKAMPNFRVLFPDRAREPQIGHGACCMVTCGSPTGERGVEVTIQASDKRNAWDKMHREFPFERIIVQEV